MDLLTTFNNLQLADIERFIADGREEDLNLEFKTVSSSEMTKEDRKNYAKALSGFTNSSGGIIVWGIDARPNNGIDCASGKKEIDNLAKFLAKLNEFEGATVKPTVDGILHRKIESSLNHGFALTLIPESISGPHMAKGGEDRYYKRSGSSFYRMEHFDVEDMFSRRRKPILGLSYDLTNRSSSTEGASGITQAQRHMVVGIRNDGRGSAGAPYLGVSVHKPYAISSYGVDGNNNFGLPKVRSSRSHELQGFGADASFVIHSGMVHEVFRIRLVFNENIQNPSDLAIDYELASQDFPLFSDTLRISSADLLEKFWA